MSSCPDSKNPPTIISQKKKRYVPAQLRRLGSLTELTKAGGGTRRDSPLTGGPAPSLAP